MDLTSLVLNSRFNLVRCQSEGPAVFYVVLLKISRLVSPTSIERILKSDDSLAPGRSLIGVDVALPRGTVLAEPLTEDNLWRQGRGSLVELSAFEGELLNQKVLSRLPELN